MPKPPSSKVTMTGRKPKMQSQENLESSHQRPVLKTALYAREKTYQQYHTTIKGVDRIYVGHSTAPNIMLLGNVVYIDTGCAFSDSALSLVDVKTEASMSQ